MCKFHCDIHNAFISELLQYVAVILMLKSLNDKGYNTLAINTPSFKQIIFIINLAAPIALTMVSNVMSYDVLTGFGLPPSL